MAIMLTACAWAGTVAHWEFAPDPDRPGIIPDRSGKGHDLTVKGDPARMRFETVDGTRVLTVSGTHSWTQEPQFVIAVRIPVAVFDPTKGFTVEMWLVPGGGFKREAQNTLFTNARSETGPGFRLSLFYNALTFASGNGAEDKAKATTWGARSAGLAPWRPGVWYHVAAVYDGSRYRVYIDGLRAGESAAGLPLSAGADAYQIGAFLDGHAYAFDGSLASVTLHDIALSGQQILASAQAAK
jgi:hypothetical protein